MAYVSAVRSRFPEARSILSSIFKTGTAYDATKLFPHLKPTF
jgi:hypothetical protein